MKVFLKKFYVFENWNWFYCRSDVVTEFLTPAGGGGGGVAPVFTRSRNEGYYVEKNAQIVQLNYGFGRSTAVESQTDKGHA